MPVTKNLGMLLLAIFLLLFGVVQVAALTFQGINFVMGGLAIAAGVCILIGR